MKALVKTEAKPGLWEQDVPMPVAGINDVLIRVLRTAICGTDMHIWKWDEWAQKTIPVPMIVGHEFVGEIVELGENVSGFEIGQIVSGEGHVVCGRCRNCMAGRRHVCAHSEGIGAVFTQDSSHSGAAARVRKHWHHSDRAERDGRQDTPDEPVFAGVITALALVC